MTYSLCSHHSISQIPQSFTKETHSGLLKRDVQVQTPFLIPDNSDKALEVTRKHVSSECRHDMWASIQLPSISGVYVKQWVRPSLHLAPELPALHLPALGLTMVRPSLKSAPEPLALHLPPMSKHIHWICTNLLTFLTSGDLDLRPIQLKTYSLPWGTFIPIMIMILLHFCFWVTSLYGTDRQTDVWAIHVMQPTAQPYNNSKHSTPCHTSPLTDIHGLALLPKCFRKNNADYCNDIFASRF